MGSFAFGLPREAVQFRTWDIEGLRKRIHLLNMLWINAMKNPISLGEKMQQFGRSPGVLTPKKKDEHVNFNIDEEEKKDSQEILKEKRREMSEFFEEKEKKRQIFEKREEKTEVFEKNEIFGQKSEKKEFIEDKTQILEQKPGFSEENENEARRRKTLEAFEKRLSMQE